MGNTLAVGAPSTTLSPCAVMPRSDALDCGAVHEAEQVALHPTKLDLLRTLGDSVTTVLAVNVSKGVCWEAVSGGLSSS